MALHPLKLPRSAASLFRMVVLQKRLLKALADPALVATAVNKVWVQNVWRYTDADWVRKFCLNGQEGRIQAIAKATPAARHALHKEFCRQNKVPKLLRAGGDFCDLSTLPDFNKPLAKTVTAFFTDCYDLLGQSSRTNGYSFRTGRVITKADYTTRFRDAYPTKIVCPYCDGDMGTPDLDHYYCKADFPLIACSPWNLVPICKSCNNAATGKGDRLALSPGPPRSSTDWLHPFEQPASTRVAIRLTGKPHESIPQLHSADAAEQRRLKNHHWLLDRIDQPKPSLSLSKRWTSAVSNRFDTIVRKVNSHRDKGRSLDSLVREQLDDHLADRGRAIYSMAHAAVCQAILDRRDEYLEEFDDSNPPRPVSF